MTEAVTLNAERVMPRSPTTSRPSTAPLLTTAALLVALGAPVSAQTTRAYVDDAASQAPTGWLHLCRERLDADARLQAVRVTYRGEGRVSGLIHVRGASIAAVDTTDQQLVEEHARWTGSSPPEGAEGFGLGGQPAR